jgi:hypothetical protein
MTRRSWWSLALIGLLVSGCAYSRMQASFEGLCLAEGKAADYCQAWADVEAHKQMTERLKHHTAVVFPIEM